jgi:hypothetical protein
MQSGNIKQNRPVGPERYRAQKFCIFPIVTSKLIDSPQQRLTFTQGGEGGIRNGHPPLQRSQVQLALSGARRWSITAKSSQPIAESFK